MRSTFNARRGGNGLRCASELPSQAVGEEEAPAHTLQRQAEATPLDEPVLLGGLILVENCTQSDDECHQQPERESHEL